MKWVLKIRLFCVVGIAVAIGYSFGCISRLSEDSLQRRKLMLRKDSTSIKISNEEKQEESVAFLISGQCQRFIYRDQPGPIFTFSRNTTTIPKVDVYVALQCYDKPVQPFHGEVDTPPYMANLNVTDIEHWYRSKGANKVEVKVLDDHTMEEMVQKITQHATTLHQRDSSANYFDLRNNMLGHYQKRWMAEARKFYSRHAVYDMSQQTQAYTGYIFAREDNYFLAPLDIDEVLLNNKKTSEDLPFVIVEEGCEFGAYSDKIYATNKLGADLLFGSTFGQFLERMKSYVLFMYYKKDLGEPYQPESFVHDSLSIAVVEKFNMKRVDLRYVKGILCIPALYYYCPPEETRNLASQRGVLNKCEDVLDGKYRKTALQE